MHYLRGEKVNINSSVGPGTIKEFQCKIVCLNISAFLGVVAHTPLVPTLVRQEQVFICEIKVYIMNSMPARTRD